MNCTVRQLIGGIMVGLGIGLSFGNIYGTQLTMDRYRPMLAQSMANTDRCIAQTNRAIAIIKQLEGEQ